MNEKENKNKLVITAIVAFIIGFGLAWLIWGNNAESPSLPEENGDTTEQVEENGEEDTQSNGNQENGDIEAGEQATSESTLSVSNQAPGRTVLVDEANLDGEAWVVVREKMDGEPGNVLGAKYVLESGQVEIPLLRGTVEGGTYYVMVYMDDGDRVFEHDVDSPLTNTEAQFMTTVEPAQ